MDTKDSFILCDNNFMSSSFSAFEDMREKGELVDFKVTSENRSFTGHRLVIAAAIPYFRGSLPSSHEETATLDEVEPDALESIINFAYNGKIKISSENVHSLLLASKFLRLAQVERGCWKFLKRTLRSSNAWKIRTIAESHGCSEMVGAVDRYIRHNFKEFSESEQFTALPFSSLKEIIKEDDLKVGTEEDVFEAVVRWVKVSPPERKPLLLDLLLCVRMSQLTPSYLIERVSEEELVQTVTLCKELVEEVKLYHLVPEKVSKTCSFTIRPRTSAAESQARAESADDCGLYAVCLSDCGLSVKLLDLENDRWVNVTTTEVKQVYKVAAFGELIYMFLDTTTEVFNLQTLKWNTLDAVHEGLLKSGVVVHRKKIYFFGGSPKGSDSIRCFYPRQNVWLEGDKMTRCLDFPGVASLASFIYVTGGCLGSDIYKAVQRYNPQSKEWMDMSPMLSERFGHGCAGLKGKIYVCGGSSDVSVLNSAEIYDPLTNQWNFVSSMKAPRTAFTAVPHNGEIYALGGLTKMYANAVDVEIYDCDDNEWKSGTSLSDDDNCEIFLVRAKLPPESDRKTLDARTSPPMQVKKKKSFVPTCYNCGRRGHFSNFCQMPKICYNCRQSGHVSSDCTRKEKRTNFGSGKSDHFARMSPSPGCDDRKCYICGFAGHLAHDCHYFERADKKCYYCGVNGHISRDCPENL